jgi:hypothetical protein
MEKRDIKCGGLKVNKILQCRNIVQLLWKRVYYQGLQKGRKVDSNIRRR